MFAKFASELVKAQLVSLANVIAVPNSAIGTPLFSSETSPVTVISIHGLKL